HGKWELQGYGYIPAALIIPMH
ncbi:uncharacterized protein METZ01_LOCUS501234, partial [marine metagenome]